MKKNTFINVISLAVGVISFIFMSLPVLKDILTDKKIKKLPKEKEWVEEPMTINELDNAKNNRG